MRSKRIVRKDVWVRIPPAASGKTLVFRPIRTDRLPIVYQIGPDARYPCRAKSRGFRNALTPGPPTAGLSVFAVFLGPQVHFLARGIDDLNLEI